MVPGRSASASRSRGPKETASKLVVALGGKVDTDGAHVDGSARFGGAYHRRRQPPTKGAREASRGVAPSRRHEGPGGFRFPSIADATLRIASACPAGPTPGAMSRQARAIWSVRSPSSGSDARRSRAGRGQLARGHAPVSGDKATEATEHRADATGAPGRARYRSKLRSRSLMRWAADALAAGTGRLARS